MAAATASSWSWYRRRSSAPRERRHRLRYKRRHRRDRHSTNGPSDRPRRRRAPLSPSRRHSYDPALRPSRGAQRRRRAARASTPRDRRRQLDHHRSIQPRIDRRDRCAATAARSRSVTGTREVPDADRRDGGSSAGARAVGRRRCLRAPRAWPLSRWSRRLPPLSVTTPHGLAARTSRSRARQPRRAGASIDRVSRSAFNVAYEIAHVRLGEHIGRQPTTQQYYIGFSRPVLLWLPSGRRTCRRPPGSQGVRPAPPRRAGVLTRGFRPSKPLTSLK